MAKQPKMMRFLVECWFALQRSKAAIFKISLYNLNNAIITSIYNFYQNVLKNGRRRGICNGPMLKTVTNLVELITLDGIKLEANLGVIRYMIKAYQIWLNLIKLLESYGHSNQTQAKKLDFLVCYGHNS